MTREWNAKVYDELPLPHVAWGKRTIERLNLAGTERVLDAGCGTGRDAEELLRRFPDVELVGIDGSSQMVEQARERFADRPAERASFHVRDLEQPCAAGERLRPEVRADAVAHHRHACEGGNPHEPVDLFGGEKLRFVHKHAGNRLHRMRGAHLFAQVCLRAEAVRRAEDVLARTEDLVEAARNAGRPLSGRFRLGVIPTVAPFLLPAKLPQVKAAYPNLKLFIREDLTPRLIAGLKAGQLDAAVIALPYDAPGIAHARIGDDEILAAAPRDHPLAAPGPIRPGSLKAEDLILLEDERDDDGAPLLPRDLDRQLVRNARLAALDPDDGIVL